MQARPGEKPTACEMLSGLVTYYTDSQLRGLHKTWLRISLTGRTPVFTRPQARPALCTFSPAEKPRQDQRLRGSRSCCRTAEPARPETPCGWRDPQEPRLKLPRGPCTANPRTRQLREAPARAINSA